MVLSFAPHVLTVSDAIKSALDNGTSDSNDTQSERKLSADLANELVNNLISLQIAPNPDRPEEEQVKFNFRLKSVEGENKLVIKIDFENPSQVSMTPNFDRM